MFDEQSAEIGSREMRTWRKLHLAADPSSGAILASGLTGNDKG